MVKRKYQSEESYSPYQYMTWPKALMSDYPKPMHFIEERAIKQRIFFPKNNAMTNVERHTWHAVENPFADLVIDEEKKRILLYAFEPDWDNRYGFYWENGWFYVYRSGVLLLRFQLKQVQDMTYRICHLQQTEASQANVGALYEAICSLRWNNSSEP